MGSLTELFGAKPRVRVLEAVLTLSAQPFTAAEAAREAGLYKPSAYRAVAGLVKEGIIQKVGSGRPHLYSANSESPLFRLLSYFETSLNVVMDAREHQLWVPPEAIPRARELFQSVLRGPALQIPSPAGPGFWQSVGPFNVSLSVAREIANQDLHDDPFSIAEQTILSETSAKGHLTPSKPGNQDSYTSGAMWTGTAPRIRTASRGGTNSAIGTFEAHRGR